MMAHTPGPWYLYDTGLAFEIIPSEDLHEPPLCIVERPSDAHLIAAAPDLLEALEAVSGIISDAMNDDDCDVVSPLGGYIFGDVMQGAISNARNAIAKAKGKHDGGL